MVLIGLGANLPSRFGRPIATITAALAALGERSVEVVVRSGWYETAPVPVSDQPWYVNAVARVRSPLTAAELLLALHAIEHDFGRQRGAVNAARVVDLDLLDYEGKIDAGWPVLPHPRLHERAFVLLPMRDVAPRWRHPVTGRTIDEMLADIDPRQVAQPLQRLDDLP